MQKSSSVQLAVVGSVGIDTIETPQARRENILGGSASYACAAASFFTKTGMVGVVGTDFPRRHTNTFQKFEIDLTGLARVPGETFHWEGIYEENMDNRRTVCTALNVFADFSPVLPPDYQQAPFLFLANIAPALQLHVLEQVRRPRFVLMDTMDLWITVARDALCEVVKRVDMLTLNESEARKFSGEHVLLKAARKLLRMGPRYVLIKKGEHGSILFSKDEIFLIPAFPLETVRDPTGAGDTFAGGFMGWLAAQGKVNLKNIRQAMLYGSVVASFGVEDFSLDNLKRITPKKIEERARQLRTMIQV